MKKITLLFAVLAMAFTTSVNAQDKESSFKPVPGSNALELSFDPSSIFATGGDQFSLQGAMIKYRKFMTETQVLRLSAIISYGSEVTITQQEDDNLNNEELKDKDRFYNLVLKPGIERHFSGTDKLSPYVGAEALIGYGLYSNSSEYQDANDVEATKITNGFFTLGAGVFAGVDYYFVESLYLGVEIGYGMTYVNKLKSKYTDSGNSDNDSEAKNGSEFKFSPSVTGNFRIGWNF